MTREQAWLLLALVATGVGVELYAFYKAQQFLTSAATQAAIVKAMSIL